MRESEDLLFGKLPSEYVENMKYLLGDDFDKYKQSLNKDSVRGLRINPLKTTLENFNRVCEFDTSVVPYFSYGTTLVSNSQTLLKFVNLIQVLCHMRNMVEF